MGGQANRAPATILSLIFLQCTYRQGLPLVSKMACMYLKFLIGTLVGLLSLSDWLFIRLLTDSERYHGLYGYWLAQHWPFHRL